MSSIQWFSPIEDIPQKSVDPVARVVMSRFNGAVAWQNTERVNGKPLRTVLEECYSQMNGLLSREDKERAEALGVNAHVNITALKVGVANAYLTDALTSGTSQLPWVIQPTPRPDISPVAKTAILDEIREGVFAGTFTSPEHLVEVIRGMKRGMRRREVEKADKAAKEMMLLMEDQCAEGGFQTALVDFLQHFTLYPYAVFAGPYITKAPRLTWGKVKPRMSDEVFPTFRAISPFDFCYSPDSPDTQRGTCVFTRTRWTRKQLIDAARLPGYRTEEIKALLEEADTRREFSLHWLTRDPDAAARDVALWASNVSPIEILTHYGVLSGRELYNYGFTGLDDFNYYQCEVDMAGHRVIRIMVRGDARIQTRPIYTASFYRTGGDRIAGDGIAQRLRDIERAYQACLMYLMRNAANASAPLCEADYSRIQAHLSDSDLGNVVPGLMYMVDSDATHGSNPALKFFNIPSNIPAYVQLMEMFMQLADRITNIPAALHGEAVGSGAMRTFRGMSLLQNNATKAFHSAVDNIASGVFRPCGGLLYNLNMLYSADLAVKGDSQIITKGAEGILQKEMERQSAMEILQVVGAAGAQLGQVVNVAPVLAWSLQKLMGAMGVPDDLIDKMQQPPAVPMFGGASGGGPNPNPNPNPGLGHLEENNEISF